jgi:hypothetical protein
MEFTSLPEGQTLPPIEMVRVRMRNDSPQDDSWGEIAA